MFMRSSRSRKFLVLLLMLSHLRICESILVCDVPVTSFNMDAWEHPTSSLLRLTPIQHITLLSAIIFVPCVAAKVPPNSLIVIEKSANCVLSHLCIYNDSPEE